MRKIIFFGWERFFRLVWNISYKDLIVEKRFLFILDKVILRKFEGVRLNLFNYWEFYKSFEIFEKYIDFKKNLVNKEINFKVFFIYIWNIFS